MSSIFPQGIPELPDAIKDSWRNPGDPVPEVEPEPEPEVPTKLVVYTVVVRQPVGTDPGRLTFIEAEGGWFANLNDFVEQDVLDLEDVT